MGAASLEGNGVRVAALLLIGTLAPTVARAAESETAPSGRPNQSVVVVVGAGGTDEYAAQFTESAELWRQTCAEGNVTLTSIGLDSDETLSDRARVQNILAEQSEQGTTPLWLVLIGHGSYDGRTAKFNLRGPDVSADELAEWLAPVGRPLAVINTASASAPFLKALSAPERTVVTATKSGFERNYTRFGRYLAETIAAPDADLDKDGQTSLLEAFLTASYNVEAFYLTAGRLATEHALLDDNGDGLGTPADWFRGIRPVQRARDGASLDGYRAHQLHLLYSDAEANMAPDLRARRNDLELQVLQLRDIKEQLPENEYFAQLEALLAELARIYDQAEPPAAVP